MSDKNFYGERYAVPTAKHMVYNHITIFPQIVTGKVEALISSFTFKHSKSRTATQNPSLTPARHLIGPQVAMSSQNVVRLVASRIL